MRALLLAAGEGTRLRPLTNSLPKCLVPVGERALIDTWFDLLFEAGIERALVNTHYLAEQVRAHVATSPWRDRIDLVHEPSLLGTGGTVLANRAYFGRAPFLVAHGDNLTDLDIVGLLAAHHARAPGCAMTMLAFHTDLPQQSGILAVDARNVVHGFFEKVANPPGTLANAAVYIFEPEIVDFIAGLGRPMVDISTEVIPAFLERIQAVTHTGYHRDIGTPASLAQARADLAAGCLRRTHAPATERAQNGGAVG